MKKITTILATLLISGCVDYKYGSYWHEKTSSKNNEAFYSQDAAKEDFCHLSPINLNSSSISSSQIISPFFVPLIFLPGKPSKNSKVAFKQPHWDVPHTDDCPMISVKDENGLVQTYTPKLTQNGYCTFELSNLSNGPLEIHAIDPSTSCRSPISILKRNSYFCIRMTEFGGSRPCKNQP